MLKIKWENTDLYESEGLNNFRTEIDEENCNWVQLIEKFCVVLKVMGYDFDEDKVIDELENILDIKAISEKSADQSDWNWNWDREEDELDQLDLFDDEYE